MLRIRLRRTGAKKQPSYRVVVADKRSARDGSFVDHLGHYNPIPNPPEVVIDEEKVLKWLRVGAQPSDTVAHLLRKLGTIDLDLLPPRIASLLRDPTPEAVAEEK